MACSLAQNTRQTPKTPDQWNNASQYAYAYAYDICGVYLSSNPNPNPFDPLLTFQHPLRLSDVAAVLGHHHVLNLFL
jgi:hypothetical protein